jgi:hypothetical protein
MCVFVIGIAIVMIVLSGTLSIPKAVSTSSSLPGSSTNNRNNVGSNIGAESTSNDKVIMINFGDSYKTQLLYAKPILDQYGFDFEGYFLRSL